MLRKSSKFPCLDLSVTEIILQTVSVLNMASSHYENSLMMNTLTISVLEVSFSPSMEERSDN